MKIKTELFSCMGIVSDLLLWIRPGNLFSIYFYFLSICKVYVILILLHFNQRAFKQDFITPTFKVYVKFLFCTDINQQWPFHNIRGSGRVMLDWRSADATCCLCCSLGWQHVILEGFLLKLTPQLFFLWHCWAWYQTLLQ